MVKRRTDTKTLEMIEETKRYKVVFDKRIIHLDTFQSYPYGYTRAKFDDLDNEYIHILVGL